MLRGVLRWTWRPSACGRIQRTKHPGIAAVFISRSNDGTFTSDLGAAAVESAMNMKVTRAGIAILVAALGGLIGSAFGSPHTSKGTQPFLDFGVQSSPECTSCHGYDYDRDDFIEPGDTWAGTVMAQSARDPLFWAALDVANHDVPQIGDFCLRCHAPGAWLAGRSEPPVGSTNECGFARVIDDTYS